MDRKTLIQKTVGAILIGLLACFFLRCSGSNDGVDETQTLTANTNCASGFTVSIANNHGHTLTVSKADITAGAKKTYTIKGSSGHTQRIILDADDFNLLKNNSSVTVTSSAYEGGTDVMHWHSVQVSCE